MRRNPRAARHRSIDQTVDRMVQNVRYGATYEYCCLIPSGWAFASNDPQDYVTWRQQLLAELEEKIGQTGAQTIIHVRDFKPTNGVLNENARVIVIVVVKQRARRRTTPPRR